MRVTKHMMIERVAQNISRNIARITDLQSQLSSGRRIEQPSDDPIGTARDLSFRTQLAGIEQFRSNILFGKSTLTSTEQSVASMVDFVHSAKEIATALINDTYDATARRSAALEVRSLYDRLLNTANTKVENKFLFSGYKTRTPAFRGTSAGVVYQGDTGQIRLQIAAGSYSETNIVGSAFLLTPLYTIGADADLNPAVTRNRLLSDLHGGTGIDLGPPANGQFEITDENVGTTVTIDVSGAVDVGDVIDTINADLVAGGITDLTAVVSPVGNAIRLEPSANGVISDTTLLQDLHDGQGIDLTQGTFRVTDHGGIDIVVDLNGLTTVGDVRTAFNNAMTAGGAAGVQMEINPGSTGLRIVDPVGYSLYVEEISGGSTANDLGFLGYIGVQLDGTDLNPQPNYTVSDIGAGVVASDLGLVGSFNHDFDGRDLDPTLTLATPVTDLTNGLGLELGTLRIEQGDEVRSVDLSGAVIIDDIISTLNSQGLDMVASLNAANTAIQIEPTANDRSLIIKNDDNSHTAERLGIYGSPDVFGNMLLLADALETNQRDQAEQIFGVLEGAGNRLLETRASVGAKLINLQTTESRLTDLELTVTRQLSEIEDADVVAVTTRLANQQNTYQAALNAAARILTPSLIDFMR